MLRQFCGPIFDLDNMTKSSAFKSEFNFRCLVGRVFGQVIHRVGKIADLCP